MKFSTLRTSAWLIALTLLPFYFNDLLFIADGSVAGWLAADYGSRILVLLLLFLPASNRELVLTRETRATTVAGTTLYAAGALALLLASDHYVGGWLDYYFPGTILFSYPRIESVELYWFDMAFGLALTAVAEELVYRKLLWHWIRPRLSGSTVTYLAPAVLFALAHWSHGVGSVVSGFIAGLVLMALYRRTRSISSAIAVHYVANFIIFYR